MAWEESTYSTGTWMFDLGPLGTLSVENMEFGEPEGQWRAIWCNVNSDIGWDAWGLATVDAAKAAAEAWMRQALDAARNALDGAAT